MFTEALPKLASEDLPLHAGWSLAADRLHAWIREALCAAHGHDLLLHVERGRRVCLRCTTCGHETPGWQTR